MQENEFEKRIQEEMGEFRLRPSDAVWEKVEEQLKKKKRRRRKKTSRPRAKRPEETLVGDSTWNQSGVDNRSLS